MLRPALCLSILVPIGACATPAPMDAPDAPAHSVPGTCDAAAGQSMIGQRATQDLGARLLARTGARSLRWGPPNSAMTMDYSEDRLNVFYDADMLIERLTCG